MKKMRNQIRICDIENCRPTDGETFAALDTALS